MDNPAKLAFLVALNKAQGLIEPVKKDATNTHFHTRYATLGSVNEAILGPLNENGFILMQGGADINGKPYLQTILYHVGGHSETFVYPLSVSDDPQKVASSMTYARKVSNCALLSLSTEDDDGNAAATPGAAKGPAVEAARKVFPASKPAPVVNGELITASFVPVAVSSKPNSKGGVSYSVKGPDGSYYSTLDEGSFNVMSDAKNAGSAVTFFYKIKGAYKNIVGPVTCAVPAEIEEVPF